MKASTDGQEPIAPSTSVERVKVAWGVTIYRTSASPSWYIDTCVNGRQIRRSLKTTKKKQATRLALQLHTSLQANPSGLSRVNISIREACSQYIEHAGRKDRTAATLTIYRRYLDDLAGYCETARIRRLGDLNETVLELFQARISKDGFGSFLPEGASSQQRVRKANHPTTVRSKLKCIRSFLRWCVKRRLIQSDPSPAFQLPAKPRHQAYCWTAAEVAAIRAAAVPSDRLILDFLRLTGLRASEFCWLTIDDFDPAKSILHIRGKQMSNEAWQPKHRRSRIIPLCSEAAEIAAEAASKSPGPWLFVDTRGVAARKYTKKTLYELVKDAMKAANVTKGTTHTYRHVFCSFLANQNVPAPIVMKIMGHGSLDIVLSYYHASTDELTSALTDVSFSQMLPELSGTVTAGQTNKENLAKK